VPWTRVRDLNGWRADYELGVIALATIGFTAASAFLYVAVDAYRVTGRLSFAGQLTLPATACMTAGLWGVFAYVRTRKNHRTLAFDPWAGRTRSGRASSIAGFWSPGGSPTSPRSGWKRRCGWSPGGTQGRWSSGPSRSPGKATPSAPSASRNLRAASCPPLPAGRNLTGGANTIRLRPP